MKFFFGDFHEDGIQAPPRELALTLNLLPSFPVYSTLTTGKKGPILPYSRLPIKKSRGKKKNERNVTIATRPTTTAKTVAGKKHYKTYKLSGGGGARL